MKNTLWCIKFLPIMILHTQMLYTLGSKKSDTNVKITAGVFFLIFTAFLGFYFHIIVKRNREEREYLKKLQAILEKPHRLELIQQALERNLNFSDGETLESDVILTPEDLAELQWGLDFIERWTASSNELAQIIPTLFRHITGRQIIPQPYQEAIARLLIQAHISPLQQIEDKLSMYNIDRAFGKGGLYYVSTKVHEQNLNLMLLLNLARDSIGQISLESLSLHHDTTYDQDLQALVDNPNPVGYANFKKAFLNTAEKILIQDIIQTTLKLALGASGWQLACRIYLGSTNYFYDPSLLAWGWQKPLLWPITGVGAAISLNAGILMTQACLAQCSGGVRLDRFKTLCYQLLFSVVLADGLWQPFADLGTLYVSVLYAIQPWLSYLTEPMVFFVVYLALSFLFKEIHNWSNRVHVENSGQKKFVCTNEFVGILTATYWSFKIIFGFVGNSSNLEKFTVANVLIDSFLAGICSVFLPILLMIGQKTKKMQTLTDRMEKVIVRLSPSEDRSDLELEQPLLEKLPSPNQAHALTPLHNNLFTTFGLSALAKFSNTYDCIVEEASNFFP